MEYKPLSQIKYYDECASLLLQEGYKLVELNVLAQGTLVKVTLVITCMDAVKDVGISDCSKAHKAVAAKLISLLGKTEDDVSMEVCSPGIERNIKNAAEFEIFTGREVRVWDKNVSDWVRGIITSSTSKDVTLKSEDGTEKTVLYEDIAKAKFIHL